MDDADYPIIATTIAKLDLRPGDVLLASIKAPVANDTVRLVEKLLRSRLPKGIDVLVVSDAVSFSIVKQEVTE